MGGVKRYIRAIVTRFLSIPLPARIGAGVALLVLLYGWVFIIPTNVQFSYTNKNACVGWFMVAPGIQHQRAGKDSYTVTPTDVTKVLGVPVFSRTVCVTPDSPPKEGRVKTSTAPFGLLLFSKTFGINTPSSPTANVGALKDKEVSAVKPLIIPLSSDDALQTYTLHQGDNRATCQSIAGQGLSCAMSELALTPSTPYQLSLFRSFGSQAPQKIAMLSVRTLNAVQLVDATVKSDTTIYDTPADFRFTFDAPLDGAEATLQRTDAPNTAIASTVKADGTTVIVTPKQPLARNATYKLTIKQVTGKDGGSLAEPIVANFTMSGGPKVTDVSVGPTVVAQNARIIVTFDQPIKADADIAKFAHLTGVNGTAARASDSSIVFTIASAPLCTAFSLVVDKGIPSGSNSEVSADAWKFDSHIMCGSSSVIGHSVRGRAIIAYTFGTGASTILFTGGMHGSEPSGATTMQAWVTYLQSNGYKIPADKTVVVVPNTNPDGIAANTRYNANDVNIDRNFPASNWRPDIDTATGTLPTGGGTSAGSEPETQALLALTQALQPRLEVSFHAQGRLVGANQYGDSTAIGVAYANTVGYQTMIGNAEEVMGYSITGEYEDWMGQALGTPAVLIELPTPSGNYLNSQMTALMKLLSV
jgi:protein MpaA